jgi:hypothetical protein
MNKMNVVTLALLLAVLGGCANMAGTMVGTSAANGDVYQNKLGAIAGEIWTNDD